VAEKRRLPVVSERPGPEGAGDDGPEPADERPPWHWVGFGTVAIFASWLPVAYLAQYFVSRVVLARFGLSASSVGDMARGIALLAPEERGRFALWMFAPHAIALAAAAFAGGTLVGRFGAPAGSREAAIAGVATSLLAAALSCASAGPSVVPLATLAITVPAAWLGASLQVRRRGRGASRGGGDGAA
jgi:hypothetical protein